MKKVYIDCGTWKGLSLETFMKHNTDYEIHAFDPVRVYDYPPEVHYHKEAVWIEDCVKKFYVNRDKPNAGSSLYKGKTTGKLDRKHPKKATCIDFPKWITDNFEKTDYIILVMNIEGAEYPILHKMMEDRTIEYIDELYVSPHAQKIKGMGGWQATLVKALEKEKVNYRKGFYKWRPSEKK